jgi:hypothetical protein
MFSNLWAHPKTTIAGILIGVLSIAGVLSQQGVTLGNAGSGTVISLICAIATALLGVISKDPGSSSSSSTAGKVGMLALFCILPIGLVLTGCPSGTSITQRQQVAQAAQNASIIVQGFQQGEIAAHQQGMIPDADHQFVQKELLTLSRLGKTTDTCIGSTTTNAGIVACVNTAIAEVDQINKDGGLYLKSDKAKTEFQLAMTGVKTALSVISTLMGSAQPATVATR